MTHPVVLCAWAVVAAALPLLLILALNGPVDGGDDETQGWWGPKSANTNWCEKDYAVSPYVAEFGNCLSSLAIVLNGIYGIWRHWRKTEDRFFYAYFIFIVVGLGSALFHGTLRREFQLLDELPMVWGNSIFIYVVKCMYNKLGAPTRSALIWSLAGITALASLCIIFFDKEDQTIFLLTYGSGVCYLLYESRKMNKALNPKKKVLLMETAILFYVGGFFLWLCDRLFCRNIIAGLHVRSMYLHCFWHLGAGIGTFCCVLFWIWTRNVILMRRQSIQGCSPIDRWIECDLLDVIESGERVHNN